VPESTISPLKANVKQINNEANLKFQKTGFNCMPQSVAFE